MTGTQWVTTIAGALGTLGGVGVLLNAVFGRGKTRAEAAQMVVGSAVTVMNEFEEDARAARQELRAVRHEAGELAKELHRLRMAIMASDATVETLRALVAAGSGPATNGRPL